MTFQDSFQNGLQQAKKNLKPALIIWGIGLSLTLLCTFNESVRGLVESLVDIRKKNDPWFTIIVFATAGAVVPFIIEQFTLEPEKRDSVKGLAVKAALWAANGIATKYVFKFLDEFVGEKRTPANVTSKVFLDQGLYVLLVTTPIITFLYLWAGNDLETRATKQALEKKPFRFRYLETYMANITVWFVAAFIMFSAPAGASIIFAMIMLAFWGIILGTMSRD